MKFPKDATPVTQANWIALQGLKLQVAESKLADIQRAITEKNEQIKMLHPSERSKKSEFKKQIELHEEKETEANNIIWALRNQIMTAQVETDCKPLAKTEPKGVHERQEVMQKLIMQLLEANGPTFEATVADHCKNRVNGTCNDDLHFGNAIKTLINNGEIQRDPNNSALISLTF